MEGAGAQGPRKRRLGAYGRMRTAGPLAPEGNRPFAGVDNFFLWIARNPLNSPESDEVIQVNPSPFPWYFLVWLGFGLD